MLCKKWKYQNLCCTGISVFSHSQHCLLQPSLKIHLTEQHLRKYHKKKSNPFKDPFRSLRFLQSHSPLVNNSHKSSVIQEGNNQKKNYFFHTHLSVSHAPDDIFREKTAPTRSQRGGVVRRTAGQHSHSHCGLSPVAWGSRFARASRPGARPTIPRHHINRHQEAECMHFGLFCKLRIRKIFGRRCAL